MLTFHNGPLGRGIVVDASGRLIATDDPVGGLYVYQFGNTGRALTVDASGMLVLSPDSNITGGAVVSGIFYEKDDHLIPDTANAFDLGATGTRFRNEFAGSGNFLNGMQINRLLVNASRVVPVASLGLDLGGLTKRFANIFGASGNLSTGTQIAGLLIDSARVVPVVNLALDLGKSAKRFSTVFTASGNLSTGLEVGGSAHIRDELRVDNTLYNPIQIVEASGSESLDLSNGNIYKLNLIGNTTLGFTNPRDGAKYTFVVHQNNAGGYTLAFSDTLYWEGGAAPTFTATSGAIDVATLLYVSDLSAFMAGVVQDLQVA